ncbi:MAG: hypothetical protein ABW022_02390 [Actinoplanes sp.]
MNVHDDDPGPPLDDLDHEILARIARDDPPPPDLDERVLFALALEDLDFEVARLSAEQFTGSGARASERTRTITFDADSRTVMITVVERTDDLVRIDGWLAPGAPLSVELRSPPPALSRTVRADDSGRFVFDEVPHGLTQLLVHPPGADVPKVVTPSLLL